MTGALLEPPAARQGPGPLPQPLIEALDQRPRDRPGSLPRGRRLQRRCWRPCAHAETTRLRMWSSSGSLTAVSTFSSTSSAVTPSDSAS